MNFTPDYLLALLVAVFTSWQVKVLGGLILLDVALGVLSALKTQQFEWSKLKNFYLTNVLPYLGGYAVLYVVVGFIIPPDAMGGLGDPISETAVTVAWGTLTLALLTSLKNSFQILYQ